MLSSKSLGFSEKSYQARWPDNARPGGVKGMFVVGDREGALLGLRQGLDYTIRSLA